MVLTPEEQANIEERFERLEERNARLERLIRSGKAFTNNPLALATDLDDLGSVKTHLDFEEAPLTPVNPPADVIRVSALDVDGVTTLATRDENGLGRTRRAQMTVNGPRPSVVAHQFELADGATQDIRGGIRVPIDWVSGTDIILYIWVAKDGTGSEQAVLRSFISSVSNAETFTFNIESNVDITQNIPASSEIEQIQRSIAGASIAAGDAINWVFRRVGGDGGDGLNESLFVRHGMWIEYTAYL